MKIGTLDLGEKPILLAPMEDVTDAGFRLLCRKMGAAMVYSEFASSDALIRAVPSTLRKLQVYEAERPVAIQIYGRIPEAMEEAARIVEEVAHPDVLDLNFGCPVKRVAGKGAGAGLLKDLPLMLNITQRVVKTVQIPVTVKTRLGWDEQSKNIIDTAEALQDCGISALTIHGRTRAQMYKGEADWTLIGKVKENPRMHIPIIGNGDITTGQQAREAFERYGVDGVMVGRATFGQPWIFREMVEAVGRRDAFDLLAVESHYEPLSSDWKLDVLKAQVCMSVERIDEYRGILHARRHLAASPIMKGIPNFRETRIAILRATTIAQLFELLESVRPLIREYSA